MTRNPTQQQRTCWIALLALCALTGCAHRVAILDGMGQPVADATLTTCYPSIIGPTDQVGRDGVAWVSASESWSSGPVFFMINSPTKGSAWIGFPLPDRVSLDGKPRETPRLLTHDELLRIIDDLHLEPPQAR